MDLSAWEAEFGATQGRIQPTGIIPPSGDHVFVLGSDVTGKLYPLNVGDSIQVGQAAEWFVMGTMVRFRATFRSPSAMPAGKRWRFSAKVDGVEVAGRNIVEGRGQFDRVDMAINVASHTTAQTLAFHLELLGSGGNELVELPGVWIDDLVFEGDAIPARVPGLHLWLRADSNVDMVDDGVTLWGDKGAGGYDASQGGAAENRASYVQSDAYFNGRPSVFFGGTNTIPQYLEWTSLPSPGGACDAFMVLRVEADPAAATSSGCWHFDTDGGSNEHYPFSDGAVYVGFGSTARKATGNPTLDLTTPHLLEMISTSSEWTMNIAGVLHYTTGTNTFGWIGGGERLGKSAGDQAWKAYLAEFILYDNKISAGNRTLIESYATSLYTLP